MEEELKQNTQQPKDGQSASPKHMSIRSILGGDILANDFFKKTDPFADSHHDPDCTIHRQPL